MCINVPTSNYNSAKVLTLNFSGVYYHVPTSNHNNEVTNTNLTGLYVIMFLHQTTTLVDVGTLEAQLYVIMFLHQTTTIHLCSLLECWLYVIMFLHQTTTLKVSLP